MSLSKAGFIRLQWPHQGAWNLMKTPVHASKAQIDKFRRLYPDSNRPTQPLNGRQVLASQ